jgi:hypothetical protein
MPELVTLPWVVVRGDAPGIGVCERTIRGTTFEQVRHGVWVPTGTDASTPDVRITAVAVQLPPHAVIGGWSAAWAHERGVRADDLDVFDGGLQWEERTTASRTRGATERARRSGARVVVCAPPTSRLATREDVRVFRSVVPSEDACVVGGLRVTTPRRTAFDMARLLPPTSAVVALDRLLHLRLVSVEDVLSIVRERRGWQGVARARSALSLADGGAESPRETLLRLLWVGAGLPRPRCNMVIRHPDGRFVARVDLLDDAAGVVGEYDGAYHASSARRSDDARRQAELERVGLVVVRATSHDVDDERRRDAWQERLRLAYRTSATRKRAWIVADR